MLTFLALYRGPSVPEAKLLAVSADPSLVVDVARHLLDHRANIANSIVEARQEGRDRVLRLVLAERPDDWA
jgi:hypothetical protein